MGRGTEQQSKRLTKKRVEKAHSRAVRYVMWDADVKGFGLRVSSKGRKVFFLDYRTRDGRQRRMNLGRFGSDLTVDQARALAREHLGSVAKGGDPLGERQAAKDAPTVKQLCERYLAEYAELHKKPKSVYNDERYIERFIKPRLGRLKVAAVNQQNIESVHRALKKSPYQANRVRALLSKMFTLAEQWRLRPRNTNPVHFVPRYPEEKTHRPLNDEELERLGVVLRQAERGESVETGNLGSVAENPRAVAAIRLMLLTGARRNEILRLRWEEVDLDAGVLRLEDSKTGRKTIRLSADALAIVEAQAPMLGNDFVFPSPVKPLAPIHDVKRVWNRLRKRAELEDVRLHDLRHSFAAIAAANGATLHEIGQLLGHRDPRTTARYADLVDEAAQKAAEKVGDAIARALAGGAA